MLTEFAQAEKLHAFLKTVDETLTNSGEQMKYEEATRIRREILGVLWRIRDGELEIADGKAEAMRKLDLITRLLLLTPVQAIDY
jgi:hypothetical protein